jgi:nickel/cobalt transporter (NiCoT) family protein
MEKPILRLLKTHDLGLGRKIIGLYCILLLANAAAWIWAVGSFSGNAILMGSAVLAYGLGLRHAVDADHIAAIDNVTRALLQKGKRPVGVGLYFSLGHSTVVILAVVALSVAATAFKSQLEWFQTVGSVVGTLVSALFLLAIALVNAIVFRTVYRRFRQARTGLIAVDDTLETVFSSGGLLVRLFRPLFRLIRHSWHMYPLGILFGLGFDTATEISLLGISAVESARGLSVWSILIFPALFTAGMSLVDASDSILMLRAYGWAFIDPMRKLYYNMIMTLVSVVVAFAVGGIEALGLIADHLQLEGGVWRAVRAAGSQFGLLGYGIVGFFLACWLISMLVYRVKALDRLEIAGPAA